MITIDLRALNMDQNSWQTASQAKAQSETQNDDR